MDYTAIIQAYSTLVNQLVGSKVAENSIDPTDVASIGLELADLLLPILNTINDFAITGGTLPPDDVNGADLDLYIQGGTSIFFWRKRNGVWVQEAGIPLGIQIVDGNISLQASVNEQIVTVSAGSWGINNIIYSKATQTQMTLTAADLNFNRIDTIVADATGTIYLLDGVASSSPDPATLPVNSIVVDYVFVPASSSGDLPYISDSNTSPSSIIDDNIVSGGKTWSSLKINRMPQPWTSDPTPQYGVRWRDIDAVTYQFYSTADNNVSEPSLEDEPGAWIKTDFLGFVSIWMSGFSYNTGNWVTGDANTNVYESKVDGNINHTPSGGVSDAFWEYIGAYTGFYTPGAYNLGDVVIDSSDSNRLYVSNIQPNNEPLSNIVQDSTWVVLGTKAGGEPPTILTEDDLFEEPYGGVWYLQMNVPDGLTVGCIDYKIGTETNRLSIDNAVTNTANTPNTKISGFPEAAKISTTEIKIKLI